MASAPPQPGPTPNSRRLFSRRLESRAGDPAFDDPPEPSDRFQREFYGCIGDRGSSDGVGTDDSYAAICIAGAARSRDRLPDPPTRTGVSPAGGRRNGV